MKVELTVTHGKLKGQKRSVEEYEKISIGRSDKADFSLVQDQKVSRFHCLLEIAPPCSCLLKDLQSGNGTFLGHKSNDKITFKRIEDEALLKNGDYIKIGDHVFCVTWSKELIDAVPLCQKCQQPIASEAAYLKGEFIISDGKPLCNKCRTKAKQEIAEGKRIGSFEVIRELGSGTMGSVYLVRHPTTQSLYAIKVIHPNLLVEEKQVQRFLKEAAIGVKLKHPHIVHYHTPRYVENARFFYIPMEYVDGVDFKTYLQKNGPLSLQQAAGPIMQVVEAVEYLHSQGLIHRDIKPANIMVVTHGNNLDVKLADFGLAKNFQEAGLCGLTLTNHIMGTPDYMAPEQCANAKGVGPQADIYSLGATIYYFLTCHKIYDETVKANILTKIMLHDPFPINKLKPELPKNFCEIIMKCLRKEPAERFATMTDLKNNLARVLKRC